MERQINMQNLHTYNKGDVIFREGENQRWMYDIVKGSVEIYVNYEKENQVLLATLAEGRYFGEIGLTEAVARTATAVAADDTQLAMISEQNFCQYFREKPEALLKIMSNMGARIRSLTNDYMEACQAIAEAAEAARRGSEKSSGLKAKLAKIVQDFIKPAFIAPSASFDIDAFMTGAATDDNGICTYREHEIIFREGEASRCMYDILWGRVGIYANYGQKNEKLLVELTRDQFFGEMGMIDNLPRSASAVALEEDTRIQRIDGSDFSTFMQEKPCKVFMILRQLSGRLRKLSEDYLEACRAVSDAAANESAGDKNSWFKDGMKRFIEEYNNAMCFAREHPEFMVDIHHPHFF